jgi:hypothetical protein
MVKRGACEMGMCEPLGSKAISWCGGGSGHARLWIGHIVHSSHVFQQGLDIILKETALETILLYGDRLLAKHILETSCQSFHHEVRSCTCLRTQRAGITISKDISSKRQSISSGKHLDWGTSK